MLPGQDPWVLCGQDMGSPTRGTWLGMTRDGRVAVMYDARPGSTDYSTNIREPGRPDPVDPPSRGQLLKSFLAPPSPPALHEYLEAHRQTAQNFVGFNLLLFNVGHQPKVGYLSNRPTTTLEDLKLGECVGLSNSPLAEPWPKVTSGCQAMQLSLEQWRLNHENEDELIERMMGLLR
jgi:uncharacterized protein with NRDE domain